MSDTASEAVTGFFVVAEILRELDERFGPDFSAAVERRVSRRMDDLLKSENDVDMASGEALAEGMEWLKGIMREPRS
ncbi:hypothetical protein [Sphingobium sp. CFD-2]|uniref:hypothetical protein n=1 Tax=Sphingobium sp. CFD-2 TaxID=2878542 RepID=UPI00214BB731|nr:hypothetical protein [Sphingobium sp. CFD-2]